MRSIFDVEARWLFPLLHLLKSGTVNDAEKGCRIRKAGGRCSGNSEPADGLLGRLKSKGDGSARTGLMLLCYCESLFSIRGSRAPAGLIWQKRQRTQCTTVVAMLETCKPREAGGPVARQK